MATETTVHTAFTLFLKEVGSYELLTAEEEIALALRIKQGTLNPNRNPKKEDLLLTGDAREAFDEFCKRNLRLVVRTAKRVGVKWGISTRDDEMLDLFQSGYLGLRKAVEKFDSKRGWRFATMAVPWIRNEVEISVINNRHTVRVPVHIMKKVVTIRNAENEFVSQYKRRPSLRELADRSGCDGISELHGTLCDDESVLSFECFAETKDDQKKQSEPKSTAHSVEDVVFAEQQMKIVQKVIGRLDCVDLDIATHRFGLHRCEQLPHYKLATIIDGMNREETRKREKRIKKLLRFELDFPTCGVDA